MSNSRSDSGASLTQSADGSPIASQLNLPASSAVAATGVEAAALVPSATTPSTSVTNGVSPASSGVNSTSTLPPGLPAPGSGVSATMSTDDISTIFVVGFPDDMTEREFQNMFTFCSGFEAAMLKTPPPPTPASALANGDDAASANGSEGNGANSTPPSSSSQKKQLRIGFAKFRSRLAALEARNVLSGRKVDLQSGAVLRAELAKKNLQMKRATTLSNGFEVGSNSPSVTNGIGFPMLSGDRSASSAAAIAPQRFPQNVTDSATFNAFYSVPTTPGSLGNEMMRKDYSNSFDFFGEAFRSPTGDETRAQALPTVGTPSARSMSFSHSSARLANGQEGFNGPSSFTASPATVNPNAGPTSAGADGYPMLSRSNSTSATTRTFFGREISGGALTNGSTERTNAANAPASATFKASQPAGPVASAAGNAAPVSAAVNGSNSDDQLAPLSGRMSQLSINTQTNPMYNGNAPPVGPLSAPAITAPRNPIPADQNPPCNTLYVGNLPVNALEDELRRMFSRMRGYRRLCFRPKPGTGPMCFVEFEDIACASQAMNELYGTPLSNSVKGGIRLSYSKNPLGVRQNTGTGQQSAPQNAQQQMQQQQQLQQLRQAHMSSLAAGNGATNGHSHLTLQQQQQLAQMKAAALMKHRLEGGNGAVHLGGSASRLALSGMATSASMGNIGMSHSVSAAPSTTAAAAAAAAVERSASNGPASAVAANGNPASAASSPMQEPSSFRWLMEAL